MRDEQSLPDVINELWRRGDKELRKELSTMEHGRTYQTTQWISGGYLAPGAEPLPKGTLLKSVISVAGVTVFEEESTGRKISLTQRQVREFLRPS
jgi:hypothetical protein